MFKIPATLLCDFYKVLHREQYPEKTEIIYSTWTPRSNKFFPRIDEIIAFGFQGFIKKYLIDYFNKNFFARKKKNIIEEYTRVLKYTLNIQTPDTTHIEELHNIGYLPIKIMAVKEGTSVPIRVPMLTIQNTNDKFFWLTNYLETLTSTELWLPSTSATIANEYRKILIEFAKKSSSNLEAVQFQAHDFSMRGMTCLEASMLSGAAHLLSFVGTDVIPAILYHENYYNANIEKELVGTSIPATEHSVMCAGGDTNEFETYKRLINDVYPNGFLSIVSDTWNLWECIDKIIKPLKADILKRDGRIVIRPDSGDPEKIICGDSKGKTHAEKVGVVHLLWEIFGGIKNDKGYKELDSHIGVIYGDAITIDRCESICKSLLKNGFASTNVVFGVGSFTYQYNTRDTFGFALKSTMSKIDGKEKMLFKDPITDDGIKKSNTGTIVLREKNGKLVCKDGLSFNHSKSNLMQLIFKNGKLYNETSLKEIRDRVTNNNN